MSPIDRALLAAAVLVACAAPVAGLGRTDLWPPDEPRVAEISREMSESGSWLIPTLNGEPFIEEPPLFYWLQAGLFRVNGSASTVAARLPAAAAGILGVLAMGAVARSAGASPLLAILALATAPEYWWMSRSATPDTAAAAATTLGLAAFLAAWQTGRRGLLAASALAFGAAFWCKSLLPIGLATVTIALFVAGAGWGRLRARDLALAATGVAVLAAGWVLVLAKELGGPAAVFFVVTNHVGRLVGVPTEGHTRSAFYYLPNLALDFFPWVVVLPAALAAAWRRRGMPERWFSLCWAAGMLLVLSASATKRAHYLLAAYPGFALLVAQWWPEAWRGRLDRAARRMAIVAMVIAGPVVGFVLLGLRGADVMAIAEGARATPPAWLAALRGSHAPGMAWVAAATLALLGLVLLRADRAGSVARSAAAVGVYVICIELLVTLVAMPRLNPLCSSRAGAERLGRLADRGVRVVAYRLDGSSSLGPVLFYARRQIPEVKTVTALRTELLSGPTCAVIRPGDYAALASVLPGSAVPTAALPGFRLTIVESTPGLCSMDPTEGRRGEPLGRRGV